MSANSQPLSNFQILRLAWKIAGGTRGFFKSWDFFWSLLLLAICYPAWSIQGWWNQPIAALPTMLGFTLGGFAIFLGFGNDNFKEAIVDGNELKSLYLSVSAAFLIFVAFQVVALLYALAASALWFPTPKFLTAAAPFIENFGNPICWALGYFLFLYSITCSLRAALRIFRVSRWYNSFLVFAAEQRQQAEARANALKNSR
ncbi:MAG: hypothetical protein V4645_29785 [Pseudomonadota bacterium]